MSSFIIRFGFFALCYGCMMELLLNQQDLFHLSSAKEPIEDACRVETLSKIILGSDWPNLLTGTFKVDQSDCFYCQWQQLRVSHWCERRHKPHAARRLTKLLPKPVRNKEKTTLSLIKAFNAVVSSSLNCENATKL